MARMALNSLLVLLPLLAHTAAAAPRSSIGNYSASDVLLGATWPASCLGGGYSGTQLLPQQLEDLGRRCWILHQHWYVFPWNPFHHSWLRYASKVFEFIGDSRSSSVMVHDQPFASDRCAHGIVRRLGVGADPSSPRGLACALGCARGYKLRTENYSLLCNNCHNMVNELAAALLKGTDCPDWCL